MEIVDRTDPPCPFCDLPLTWDGALDFLEGDSVGVARVEGCRGKEVTLLDRGLGVVRLIDGEETESVATGDSFMRDRSAGAPKDRTRERGVDGTDGAAFLGRESEAPNLGLLERAVRAEPATDDEAFGAAESC